MIEKKIHYCWFGGNPLPESAKKCILSWKKFFPDYEIVEWNETNCNLNACDYVKEAYNLKKWAFVSDYIRLKVLYEYGGIYFDTDVEVIKSFEPIIEKGNFLGCEATADDYKKVYSLKVNPGIGMGVSKKNKLIKEIVDDMEKDKFIFSNGKVNKKTIVERVTQILKKKGLKDINEIQKVENFNIYTPEYFCPFNFDTQVLNITSNTYSIHWYDGSWLDPRMEKRQKTKVTIRKKIKNKTISSLICFLYTCGSHGVERIEKLFYKIKNES